MQSIAIFIINGGMIILNWDAGYFQIILETSSYRFTSKI